MGKIEDKIKQDIMGQVFNDTFKIYEFIDGRFKLDEQNRTKIISKLNNLNDELTKILKEVRLS